MAWNFGGSKGDMGLFAVIEGLRCKAGGAFDTAFDIFGGFRWTVMGVGSLLVSVVAFCCFIWSRARS